MDFKGMESRLRVIHTIAGTRADHGGTSRSVPALCESLATRGAEVHLLTTSPASPEDSFRLPAMPVQCHLVPESARWGRLWAGRRFERQLQEIMSESSGPGSSESIERTVIHDHGVWLTTNHGVARYCRRNNVPRVVSPRGMLSGWAMQRGQWKKRMAWLAYQRSDLLSATAFHVTSELEAGEVRALGFRQPIANIPNGITFPQDLCIRRRETDKRRMLFLSRIHPKKGLLELVRAWKLAEISNDWELIIAGPDDNGHAQQVRDKIRSLGLEQQIRLTGPVDDEQKWQVYSDADVFVLPSFSENFGIVIAEALAAGLPVMTTTGTPWSQLPELGFGWWVAPAVDSLSQTLRAVALLSPGQLRQMGQGGASWVRSQFQWGRVAEQMILFYRWLIEHGEKPDFVDTSR